MAKKIVIDQEITSLDQPWGGTYASGQEWGLKKERVETFIKSKLSEHETSIGNKVSGVIVNNTEVTKDLNGKVSLNIPTVSTDVTNTSNPNAAQAGAVAVELNAQKSQPFGDVRIGDASADGTEVALEFYSVDDNETPFATVNIPAAQEIGEVIAPKITTELLTPALIKLGDIVAVRWNYDCIRKADGASESVNIPALNVNIVVKIGQTTVYSETKAQVPVNTTETLTIGSDIITSAGTVSVSVEAVTIIDEETKRSRGSKSVTVITMDLASTFDPASQLALTNGYSDSASSIEIPYTYTVPTGTTLRVWLDGVLHATETISGTGRNYVRLTPSNISAGRHNVQMVAESAGLLSNAISLDFLKAGSTANYLGLRMAVNVAQLSDMPLAYDYGTSALPLTTAQFESLTLDFAAWNNATLNSTIEVSVDGIVTQTLTADRTLQTLSQRFDVAGTHTLVIKNGSAVRTFAVEVSAAAGVTETETVGYRNKLTSTGRSNSEENPSDWGGITTFVGVDWRTNGWNIGSDGVNAMLLTNGARSIFGIQPFIQDETDGDYSIQNRGMTLEFEIMISQVMQRGATVLQCLYDNDGQGYPMGIRITTEEAGIYFGGVEEITTAEDLVDENGNYIDYDGNIVPESQKVPLKIKRPHATATNIATNRWLHIAFVVQPVRNGYGLAMLFINGKLSRANRYSNSLRQNTPQGITVDSNYADVRIRGLRYYRTPLIADEVLSNFIIDRPTAALIQSAHNDNAVGDANNTTDSDGNIAISRDTLLSRGRGVLTIIRSDDAGTGLDDLFTGPNSTDKKWNFKADLVRWEPPLDENGNKIGEGFEARNVRIRIQGTSSVKYPYKNIRIYLTTAQGGTRTLVIGGVDVTATAKGYALRGSGNSIEQAVLCAKTDFVDSSMAGNTGGAQLFHEVMLDLGEDYLTPPQKYDSRVRQAIDGIPCDIFGGKSETGTLTYCGQFVLNNEKSKSGKIFGMEGVSGFSGDAEKNPMSIALEALTNSSPMTLFQPAGSENSTALANQLAEKFDDGFEFNFPEDATWENVDEGQVDVEKTQAQGQTVYSVKPVPGARQAIKRWLGWIYDCVPSEMRTNPEYGDQNGWSAASRAKWVSSKFKTEISNYFNLKHLLTYYLIIDYLAGKDQLAKNILWRTWDGLKWYSTFYDGDTWEAIRNDAFIVYLYNITRDSYDSERAKYAFEGHSSWLWCLVLANFEDELKECARTLRAQLTTERMLRKFRDQMIGNWSARQYNKSGKLKYIDTIEDKNYVYTLTGSREEHITQFLTDRSRLRDARYGAGEYDGDVMTFTVVRSASDTVSSLKVTSGDLYYFGYKLNGRWIQGPTEAANGESVTLEFRDEFATNDPLMLGGASCIRELDFTNMGNQLNGSVGLSLCTMLSKLIMPATNGVANAPLTFGNTSKLEYVDITGQTAVNTGTAGLFDVSKHTRLTTFLAGGTSLTRIILPEGSPLETLVMPSTLQTLTLRYLPKLHHSGLTLQGTSNITALNFAECPYLSWQTIMQMCPNIDHVRIEGMSGRVRSSMIRPFMSGFRGLTATGSEQTYPALIGKVQLIDVVDDFDEMKSFFTLCGLEIEAAPYSHYIFDDLVTDPANITNEDNQTGRDYATSQTYASGTKEYYIGNYEASGHVKLLHDKCQLCSGIVNPRSGKMNVTKLSKDSLTETADGNTFNPTDPNGEGFDVFMYLPKYWYKGVNDYKNARKHFFLSSFDDCPVSSATTLRYTMEDVLHTSGKAIDNRIYDDGDIVDALLVTATECSVYKVPVDGMKQVRFPGINHSYFSHVFTDENGVVISIDNLLMADASGNPADFMNDEGDYDFRDVPENAKYLYFTCRNLSAEKDCAEVIVTNSPDIEAIEPDWVEHKSELIGVYQGFATGVTTGGTATSGLRSISGKVVSRGNNTATTNTTWTYDSEGNATKLATTKLNGTAQDFFNLASVRNAQTGVVNGEYSTVPYETSKDMANLLMVWFGTRDVETLVGRGSSAGETTGVRNSIAFGDTSYIAQNQHNKMWGLECWTASTYEWTDKGCLNAPSWTAFKAAKRPVNSAYVSDKYYNIMQQDGNERRVKAAYDSSKWQNNLARVRFGRYCDIVAGSYAGDTTYATCYAAYQSTHADKGRVLGRSSYNASAYAGVAYSFASYASSLSDTLSGGRLCFFGEIENEDELL